MKTLILNGSPRPRGNTSFLAGELAGKLEGETVIVNAYTANIKPCIDCRRCWETEGCVIRDGMDEVYGHILSAGAIVIASPLHYSELTAPLLGLLSRLQCYYAASRFLGLKLMPRGRLGAVVITGGGDGGHEKAMDSAEAALRHMGAKCVSRVLSLKTDALPAWEDGEAADGILKLAERINAG